MNISYTKLFVFALVISAVQLLPLLATAGPGGDIIFHFTLIDCFSTQLWQGNLYPRWCLDADADLGSAPFLFYFPFAYYLAAFVYPLHSLGVPMDTVYLIILWIINVVTFFTCRQWLKDIISPGRATLIAIFYLFMPYRMELLVYRSAYAELWCLAWLPLLFLFTRHLTQGEIKYWSALSCVIAVCLLTHVPATLAGLFACGLQVLCLSPRGWTTKLYFALAVLLGGMATLFYTLPAKHFSPYLYAEVLDTVHTVWANSYVVWEDLTTRSHIHLMVGLGATVALVSGLSILMFKNRTRIDDRYVWQETRVWIITAFIAFFLLFKISDPLWQLFTELVTAAFPWRMQVLLMCAATYLLAIKSQWLMSEKNLKTWKADYVAAVGVTMLFGLFMFTTRDDSQIALFNNLVRHHIVQATVYRTQWTSKEFYDSEHVIALSSKIERVRLVRGRGHIDEEKWDAQGITLLAHMKTPGLLRLKQRYFPLWILTLDGKRTEFFEPEKSTGLMQVSIPAGTHRIELTPNINMAMGWPYTLAKIISGTAALGLLYLLRRNK